ncbi:MAG: excinuclease ABC subunit UvrC, partial [Flavobacteriales bacterium]|nr:excinuclease ABC subunit UvrC [Flavobacteriales bacterium]
TRVLVSKVKDLEYIVVDTEYDALFLENSLIKKFQPKYNIQLKDDKSYPWICIKKERFPRVFPTRRLIKDGSKYYGPYANVKVMNNLLDMVSKLYQLRNCSYDLSDENIKAGKFRACLEYHIGNCKAPCVGKQLEDDYNESIEQIRQILGGSVAEVIKNVKIRIVDCANNLEFERAAYLKNRLEMLEKFQTKSTIVNPIIHDVEVYTIKSEVSFAVINFMKVNNGTIVQSHNLELKKKLDESDEDLLMFGILELRERFGSASKEIYLNKKYDIDIQDVSITVPKIGDKKKLMQLSVRNLLQYIKDKKERENKVDPDRHTKRILSTLQSDLKLKELPVHIECFDNSNFQGASPVAACVVFKNAKPSKKDYRHFNIKTVEGPDDFASMKEVVTRRYSRLLKEQQDLPQLIIIDGGKGQLSSAVEALESIGLRGKIPIIGIAKKLEEIFFPEDPIPLHLDKRSESLKLIQSLRNEAHRFGITHHRSKRDKATLKSELTDIKGVGKQTASRLLEHFKSVKRIKSATLEEIESVIGNKKAKIVLESLKGDI